ncbi:DegT/DnrJ/EryC1/StrS family aminotransferase [Roseibium aggregatum]|uniref:DegT/DnrJ/EryC1/StrS family aminotransferase n=1 Tax=Roseibium aggregatum TaxID=187304 RepID=UPI0025AC7328|nr:DegT/DnrJ/EryC1/StrS family aminotransferase [Roseibium aggregatum]WJS05549.1 DegT/DnrJ/EryC1/StrS family aminotransferase [Roseibium aggregatum]
MAGGPGMRLFGAEERDAVLDVLSTLELSRYRFDNADETCAQSHTYRFERNLEELLGIRHCLGMNSCTSALLTGLWATGIGPGDEVIVPGYTFVASMAAVAYTGAKPVLAEIDDSLTLDPEDVASRITPRTRAILCVHMLGMPCDMAGVMKVAVEHGLMVFEDCAQACGGMFRGRSLGSFGRFGATSLNVFKTFTAGDGGVFFTHDSDLYHSAFAIHDHGSKPGRLGVVDAESLLGLNFRMHEMTGALAGAQLAKLPSNLARLRQRKVALAEALGNLPGARLIESHDPEGECGTVLAIRFEAADHAAETAEKLGIRRLEESGKHNYRNIPQLGHLAVPRAISATRAGHHVVGVASLPHTDDILGRTLIVGIGLNDSYLGAGLTLDPDVGGNGLMSFAEGIRSAIERTS